MAEVKVETKKVATTKVAVAKDAPKKEAAVKVETVKTTTVKKPVSVDSNVAAKTVTKIEAVKTVPVKTEAVKKVAPVVKEVKKAVEKKVVQKGDVGKVRVTMVHGLGSCTKRQIKTAKALKLSRPGDTRELPNLPSTLGACKKLEHLVKVEKI